MTTIETLADPESGTLRGIVDLDRYPVEDPLSNACKDLVDVVRCSLERDGLVSLDGFLLPEALARATAETAAAATHVPLRRQSAGVYHRPELTCGEVDGDPRRRELTWFAGHVTRDMIPPFAVSHRLYASANFKRFIAACVGRDRVFEYADPLAGLVATVLPPDGCYPWHYDTNEYVVTIMTQKPQQGGRFEYCKNLRTPGDENLEGLASVLDGRARSLIRSVSTEPGALQLFLGRYSLHQVTKVEGERARHVLVLSYADRPGVIGPVDRTRSVYGRVTEAHLIAEQEPARSPDGLIL